jgi:hypothetical protein
MGRPRNEFDLLLKAPHPVEAELARGLLEEAGIPTMLHGSDFDVAELGSASHGMLRRPDLYVPKGARARAESVLRDGGYDDPIEADVGDDPPTVGSRIPWVLALFLVALVTPLVFLCIDEFRSPL